MLGQDALGQGRLDDAEHAFRQVLARDPQSGGAYANLGVVYMRRKQFGKALEVRAIIPSGGKLPTDAAVGDA